MYPSSKNLDQSLPMIIRVLFLFYRLSIWETSSEETAPISNLMDRPTKGNHFSLKGLMHHGFVSHDDSFDVLWSIDGPNLVFKPLEDVPHAVRVLAWKRFVSLWNEFTCKGKLINSHEVVGLYNQYQAQGKILSKLKKNHTGSAAWEHFLTDFLQEPSFTSTSAPADTDMDESNASKKPSSTNNDHSLWWSMLFFRFWSTMRDQLHCPLIDEDAEEEDLVQKVTSLESLAMGCVESLNTFIGSLPESVETRPLAVVMSSLSVLITECAMIVRTFHD